MTGPQGEGSIERLCAAARVSRASFYRHWQAAEPAREETALRDAADAPMTTPRPRAS
jgi:AcrR family transcriptional regulator